MNVTHVWEWGWDAYTIGMIHDKYSKLITSLCYLLHQCICVCCLNVGEGGALNEIKQNKHSNLLPAAKSVPRKKVSQELFCM